jgi:hypothetical protein
MENLIAKLALAINAVVATNPCLSLRLTMLTHAATTARLVAHGKRVSTPEYTEICQSLMP